MKICVPYHQIRSGYAPDNVMENLRESPNSTDEEGYLPPGMMM